jgi:DMSO/TMAO reductase YedYZ molybdopterin-dependent catalytic subunit
MVNNRTEEGLFMFFGKQQNNEQGRVPPDQTVTTKWPVLHYGEVPNYTDMSKWDLKIFGLVDKEKTLSYDELLDLPQVEVTNDIHCVTGWSKLDNIWQGVRTKDVLAGAGVRVKAEANYVLLHAEEGWTTNLPLLDFLNESSILAHSHNGEPLTPDHGYPLRVVVPHLYFWKSAKWLRAIEFLDKDKPGFWERNGYHVYGDPWKSQRFSWD